MFGHDFYHGTLRRHVIMFGNLFNDMQIKRFDQNNNTIQTETYKCQHCKVFRKCGENCLCLKEKKYFLILKYFELYQA